MASRFEQYIFVNLNCFVLFKLNRDAAKNGRRTTNLVEWTPLNRWQQTAIYGLLGPGPEKIYKKVQENNHESRSKISLKTSIIFINHNRKQIKSIL